MITKRFHLTLAISFSGVDGPVQIHARLTVCAPRCIAAGSETAAGRLGQRGRRGDVNPEGFVIRSIERTVIGAHGKPGEPPDKKFAAGT